MADVSEEERVKNSTISGLVATLIPTLIIAGVYILIFLILRMSQRRYYAPRTYLGSLAEHERTPALPTGFLNWVGAFWKIPDVHALRHQSLDAYLFLRFLRVVVTICVVGCLISWPVLFPINATGEAGAEGLDVLSYSNIKKETQANRYYAHVFVAWALYGFVLYMIMRELIFYINLRQAFLLSPIYSKRISSRTVLFTSVPTPYLDTARLRKVFGDDSVKNVWISGDTEKLDKVVEERDKVAMQLEKAEVKLIKLANAERLKSIKGGTPPEEANQGPPAADAESGSLASRWIPDSKRPTHRTGLLGLIGQKVDTIHWCRGELERLIPEVEAAQAQYRAGDYKKIPGVFIEFHTQSEAEAAYQVLAHHQALHMTPRYIGIRPDEVVWKSLAIPWWQKVIRRYLVIAFITAMIIFWAIPVGFVAAISNVPALASMSWLSWINKIPPAILGVITGLLPAVLLAILMSLVPVIMRICAKLAGEPSLSRVELFTQNAYFAFQLIQVFLVATLGSSAAALVEKLRKDPGSVTTLLSENLPKASNIYISYFMVQGFTVAASVLSQVVGFIIFTLLYKYLASTPRALYSKWANLSAISWGSTMPVYTNIAVIGIAYAGIAPLMLGWAALGQGLFYLAYRYNILFVTDTKVDTRGLMYPRALKQLLAGIYIAELCMIGLFAASAAIGPLILMIVFLIFTGLFHATLSNALDPLLYNMPRTLLIEEESTNPDPEAGVGTDPGQGSPDTEVAADSGSAKGAKLKKERKQVSQLGMAARGNMVSRFLKPWVYADYATLRTLVPRGALGDLSSLYSSEVEENAYFPPTVTSATPLLWIPEDAAGISKQEIALTGRVIPITDEGCTLDDKNKLQWDAEGARPPLWEEKVHY